MKHTWIKEGIADRIELACKELNGNRTCTNSIAKFWSRADKEKLKQVKEVAKNYRVSHKALISILKGV